MIPLLKSRRHWVCPNCSLEEETGPVSNRFHSCPGLHGLTAPMIPAGTAAKVYTTEREDYVGTEQVQMHEGRPVMNVITERPDGSNDVVVFAPTATGRGETHGLE